MEAAPNPVRPAAMAGSWYPADPGALAAAVDGYLAAAAPPPPRRTTSRPPR